jgi:hypothetical protein
VDIALSTLISLETVLRQLGGGAALPTMLPAWTLQRLTAAAARLRESSGPIHVDNAPADVSPRHPSFLRLAPLSPLRLTLSVCSTCWGLFVWDRRHRAAIQSRLYADSTILRKLKMDRCGLGG